MFERETLGNASVVRDAPPPATAGQVNGVLAPASCHLRSRPWPAGTWDLSEIFLKAPFLTLGFRSLFLLTDD